MRSLELERVGEYSQGLIGSLKTYLCRFALIPVLRNSDQLSVLDMQSHPFHCLEREFIKENFLTLEVSLVMRLFSVFIYVKFYFFHLCEVFIYVKACSLCVSSDLCDRLWYTDSDLQDFLHSLLQLRPVGILFWAFGRLHSASHEKTGPWSSEVYFTLLHFWFHQMHINFPS